MSKAQTIREAEAEAAANGAKAGAKARRREASEGAAQTAAVLAAETGDRDGAVWVSTYRAGTAEDGTPDRRTIRHAEDARRHVTAAELLAAGYDAAKIAAGTVAGRHGIPPLAADEIADVRDELVTRLLTECNPEGTRGTLPARDRITRAYLVQRARGIIMDDPERVHTDANMDGGDVDPADLAEGAEAQARSRRAAHDPMLIESADGTWPEIAAAADIISAPPRAGRAAAYLTGGGRAESWARHWRQTPKQARQKTIPVGTDWLRRHAGIMRAAVKLAAAIDRDELDAHEERRAAIRRGLTEAPRPARATIERRDRTRPEIAAPVTIRRAAPDADAAKLAEIAGAPVAIKSRRRTAGGSRRTRKSTSARAGWTAPRV